MPWGVILANIADAREQLQEIEARVHAGHPPDDIEFEVMIRHAYHHLNFAWNMRNYTLERYADLSDEDFDRWGRFPDDLGGAAHQ